MYKYKDIFEEMNSDINPYKELKIPQNSSNETIKEAYKIAKKGAAPYKLEIIELSYNTIQTKLLRERYSLVKNRPLYSLDNIKEFTLKPKKLETEEWLAMVLLDMDS